MWKLADETVKLFDATIEDMGVNINYFLDGGDGYYARLERGEGSGDFLF
jgi:hypothetical protein